MEERKVIEISIGEDAWAYSLSVLQNLTLGEEVQAVKGLWLDSSSQPSLFLIGLEETYRTMQRCFSHPEFSAETIGAILPTKPQKFVSSDEQIVNPFSFLENTKVT